MKEYKSFAELPKHEFINQNVLNQDPKIGLPVESCGDENIACEFINPYHKPSYLTEEISDDPHQKD